MQLHVLLHRQLSIATGEGAHRPHLTIAREKTKPKIFEHNRRNAQLAMAITIILSALILSRMGKGYSTAVIAEPETITPTTIAQYWPRGNVFIVKAGDIVQSGAIKRKQKTGRG
jgi:hypothetical protein